MRKRISVLFLCLMLICLSACFDYNDSPSIITGSDPEAYKDTLSAVLNNKKSFIAENGSAYYLKDYNICNAPEGEPIPVSPCEYTYVDLDGDLFEEMIVNISSEHSYYLILHYNSYDIFGYEIDATAMTSIKTDGTFSYTSESNTIYCRLSFKNRKLKITQEAVCDYESGVYQIGGLDVTADSLQEYLQDWEQKADIVWTKLLIQGANQTESIPTEGNTSESDTTTNISPSVSNGVPDQETSVVCIDLSKYILINYSGYSGAGCASISLDKDRFLKDNGSIICFKNNTVQADYFAATGDSSSAAEVFFSFINKISISADSALKNGDIITIKWNINNSKIQKYFSVNYSFSTDKYTVSGLIAPVSFNPMDYIRVSYTGTAPCGQLYITTNTSKITDKELADKIVKACNEKNFTYRDTIYAPGDTIELIYSPVDLSDPKSLAKFIDTYGLLPITTQQTFTLTGFPYHPTSIEQINADILNDADSLCLQKVAADDYLQIKNISRTSAYYVTPSPSEYDGDSGIWSLYVIYKVDATAEFWNLNNAPTLTRDVSYYYIIEFPSIKINADGILTHSGYSTLINPVGRNGGAGFVYWESDGKIFDTKPTGSDETIIEHCCYPDGFATLDEIDSVLRSKGNIVEIKNY